MNYDNICEICFTEFNDFNVILNCNHKFHINCFKLSVENKKNKSCPYCRTNVNNDIIKQISTCQAIVKSGKNKGNQCKNFSKFNLYCGVHKNIELKINENN